MLYLQLSYHLFSKLPLLGLYKESSKGIIPLFLIYLFRINKHKPTKVKRALKINRSWLN